jgi:glutaryl-CoA dehydrogenase
VSFGKEEEAGNLRNAKGIEEKWLPPMARDILGGRGILADHQVIRHLCDLEAMSTLEGTESMHTLIIGQDLTGISALV